MPCQTSEALVPNVHRLLGIGSEIIRCLLIQKFFYFYFTRVFFQLALNYLFRACAERWKALVCFIFFLQVTQYKVTVRFKNV